MIRVGDAAEANSTCNYGIRSRIQVSKARESLACLHPYKCVMSYQNSGELHSKKKENPADWVSTFASRDGRRGENLFFHSVSIIRYKVDLLEKWHRLHICKKRNKNMWNITSWNFSTIEKLMLWKRSSTK